jgi:hypothetical protein
MERDEDLEDGEMEDREREDGGGVASIYDEQSSAGGAAEISAAHPITSFIPPPRLHPYNRLLAEVLMERDEDLEGGEMEDREREDGGGVANIYDEQSIAGGAAEISAAHPTPSFIPPPLKNPYHRLLAEVLMERDEDLNEVEMEERETEDGGEGSNIYDEQGSPGDSAEISLDIPIRLIENRTQPFFIHSNATATASGPLDASAEHKVRRMPMRKKKFGRSAQRGGNRKYGCGGMPVAINRAPVAQVTAANKTPAKYLTKSELYTSLMESEVRINISMFYIS